MLFQEFNVPLNVFFLGLGDDEDILGAKLLDCEFD